VFAVGIEISADVALGPTTINAESGRPHVQNVVARTSAARIARQRSSADNAFHSVGYKGEQRRNRSLQTEIVLGAGAHAHTPSTARSARSSLRLATRKRVSHDSAEAFGWMTKISLDRFAAHAISLVTDLFLIVRSSRSATIERA
jgi:hypothetical protein